MEVYYILIVAVLFLLAISDLIVGVSNDAVNFLNSAIGSKAAPFKIILAIAALGVLVGAVFSNGMMEVARKGIFHPDMFFFAEIMVIFLAVMITDVILLDSLECKNFGYSWMKYIWLPLDAILFASFRYDILAFPIIGLVPFML